MGTAPPRTSALQALIRCHRSSRWSPRPEARLLPRDRGLRGAFRPGPSGARSRTPRPRSGRGRAAAARGPRRARPCGRAPLVLQVDAELGHPLVAAERTADRSTARARASVDLPALSRPQTSICHGLGSAHLIVHHGPAWRAEAGLVAGVVWSGLRARRGAEPF